jgi:hypothetical protein
MCLNRFVFLALVACIAAPLALPAQDPSPTPVAQATPPATELPVAEPAPAAQPVVQGRPYQEPNYVQPRISKAELYTQIGLNIVQLILAARQKPPQQRQRGENIRSAACGNANYRGRCEIYQFTNFDFPSTNNSSGQAALATAMWNVGLSNKNDPRAMSKRIWELSPPKITLGNLTPLQGTLGTDWRQINHALDGFKAHGIKYTWIDGEAEIKKYLGMNLPVVIMLDAGTLPQYDYKWWTGHWVTAFGYDPEYIYVSNFPQNRLTWKQLDDAFRGGTLAKGHGTSGKAAVIWK